MKKIEALQEIVPPTSLLGCNMQKSCCIILMFIYFQTENAEISLIHDF